MNQQRHTTEDTLTDIFGSEEMRNRRAHGVYPQEARHRPKSPTS